MAQSTKPQSQQSFCDQAFRDQAFRDQAFRDQSFRDQSKQRSSFFTWPKHNIPFRKNPINKPYWARNVETAQIVADYHLPTLQDVKPTDNFVAGRVKHVYLNWWLITSDPEILSTVQGYKIAFVGQAIQWRYKQT